MLLEGKSAVVTGVEVRMDATMCPSSSRDASVYGLAWTTVKLFDFRHAMATRFPRRGNRTRRLIP